MTLSRVAIASAAIAGVAVLGTLYLTRAPDERVVVEKPCGDRIFGHIASLERRNGRYEMRFDPAWFTSGVTANSAAAEDGVVQPGEPVPNDNYRIDEGHRLLTYLVSPKAHVTVLTRTGQPTGFGATRITVAELEQLVHGRKPKPAELFEPLDTGVWIRVRIDTACAIDQQYQP